MRTSKTRAHTHTQKNKYRHINELLLHSKLEPQRQHERLQSTPQFAIICLVMNTSHWYHS